MAPNPPTHIGEYKIVRKLGEGSMGVVYQAQRDEDSPVALKVLSPRIAEDPEFVHRFLREMQAVSMLHHPHVVRAVDYGVDVHQNLYFVALEFVNGMSLQNYLNEQGALPVREALRITREVALGLQHAFEQGLIHRDVKPENILLDEEKRAKLTDFGLAKPQGKASITATGIVLGTPFYLAPEQAMAEKEIDVRADIYSLGITLYHMLAGRPPFVSQNPLQVISAHCFHPLPPLRDYAPGVPLEVEELLKRMTAKQREERFSTPEEVAVAIEAILAEGTVSANGSASGGGDSTSSSERFWDTAPTQQLETGSLRQGDLPGTFPQGKSLWFWILAVGLLLAVLSAVILWLS